MSNLGPMAGQSSGRMATPMPPKGEPIARYDTYLEAQRAVDYLSDNHFPVKAVTIVGTGLQMVERVTGRLNYPRVALAGAASGAWFGLIFGIVLSLFGGTEGAVIAGPLFGAAAGVMFGVFSYSLTRGRRDFTSASQIVASEYAVLCHVEHAGAARQLLRQLPGGTGRDGGASPWISQQPPTGAPSDPDLTLGVPPVTKAGGTTTGATQPWGDPAGGPSGAPAGGPGSEGQPVIGAAPPASSQLGEPGLTYGEAIERQKRERLERERAERAERARLERERAERESAQ